MLLSVWEYPVEGGGTYHGLEKAQDLFADNSVDLRQEWLQILKVNF